MNIGEFARRVLLADSLEEKLEYANVVNAENWDEEGRSEVIDSFVEPGRPPDLQMRLRGEGNDNARPGVSHVSNDEERGRLLHFFANHELLATELMALVLLKFPEAPREFRLGVLQTLQEEQRHTRLYIERMKDCGVKFGDFPVSRYFWDMVSTMETPLDYVTRLSLTFEQANLDYSLHYAGIMEQVGDSRSAAILNKIYRDEIRHVNYGLKWFRRWKKKEEDDWTAFRRQLTFPLSPRRAKGGGSKINREGRVAAGLDEDFISELEVFEQSTGRTPNVFVFCPDAEDAMSGGLDGGAYHRSKMIDALIQDLDVLSLFLARRDDVVLLRNQPARSYLEKLRSAGFDLPEIEVLAEDGLLCSKSSLDERKINSLRPWAWCPLSAELLEPLAGHLSGRRDEIESRWNEEIRQLFSKQLAAEVAELVEDRVGGLVCDRMEDVEQEIARLEEQGHGEVVVKAAFGASGRGLMVVRSGKNLREKERGQIERLLDRQGLVLIEPWLPRVQDFSVQYEMEAEGLRRLGMLRLENDRRGQFRACVAGSKFCSGMPGELARFMMEKVLPLYEEGGQLTSVLEERFQKAGYQGPVGVDAFVYRDRKGELQLRRLCEVNPRYTMGRLTLELGKRVAPGNSVRLELVKKTAENAEESFQVNADGLLCDGWMYLNDVENASNFLALLTVSKKENRTV